MINLIVLNAVIIIILTLLAIYRTWTDKDKYLYVIMGIVLILIIVELVAIGYVSAIVRTMLLEIISNI